MELWDDYENTVTEAVMEDRKRPGTNWRVSDVFAFFTRRCQTQRRERN